MRIRITIDLDRRPKPAIDAPEGPVVYDGGSGHVELAEPADVVGFTVTPPRTDEP